MRSVKRSIEVPAPVEQVWAWLDDLGHWDEILSACDVFGAKFKHLRLSRPEGDPAPPSSLGGKGAEIQVLRRSGREALRWRVSEWLPPQRLALFAKHEGFVSGHQVLFALELEPAAAGSTRVHMSLYLMMHNLFIEFSTLVLPMRFLYARMLNRGLRAIQRGFVTT